MSINFQDLIDLLQALNQTDVRELELKTEEFKIKLSKGELITTGLDAEMLQQLQNTVVTTSLPATAPAVEASPAPSAGPTPSPIDPQWKEVTSPMVGTFYRAPAPGEPAFVDVGDRLSKGQTVCIIEAMKLMNEIEAEFSGEVVEIVVEDGEPVEFGQTLMWVKPN